MKPIKKHLIFFVLSLLSVQFSFAQTPTWKEITPAGWSGTFQFVEYFTGNGLVAIADNGYFYHSLDTGLTWTAYPKPVASVDWMTLYSDHKRAYICGGSHLYKTIDAAKSWQEIKWTGMPSNIDLGRIYIKTEDTLLMSASDGVNGMKIYLSPDKGQTWTKVAENLYNNFVYGISGFYFVNPAHGYALAAGYYAETTDGGHSWIRNDIGVNTFFYGILEIKNHSTIISTNTSTPPPTSNATYFKGGIDKIVQAGTMLYGIYDANFFSSADSGKTWKIKPIDANKLFKSITFLDQQTGVAVGNFLTTYRTTNGGTTWTKYVHGGAEGFNKIYSKTKDECYITGNTGRLFHTTDGGVSWTFRDLNNGALQNVVFPTPDTGYVSASGVIFRTIDAGNNWTKFIQPDGGSFLSFPTKDTGYVGFSSGWIDKTVDAGQTWNPAVDNTYITNNGGNIGACFRSTNEGLVSSNNSLLYTNDGGTTWKIKATGIHANEIIATNDKGWVILSNFDSTVNSFQQRFIQMYKCDKDINCKKTVLVGDGGGLKRVNDSTLCFGRGDSIYFSKDYGNTWMAQKYWAGFYDLSFPTSQIAFSIGNSSIFKAYFASNLNISNIQAFNKLVTGTLSTISEAKSLTATLYLLDNRGDTIYYLNKLIENGLPFSINLPETIIDGTYSIVIMPDDTLLYNKVQSLTFTINSTEINSVELDKNLTYKIIGNKIISDCPNIYIFNTLGQRMQNNIELPVGIYIVKCNNKTQKVIIKP